MMVDVVMADGRTTYRFHNRGAYIALVTRKPADLGDAYSIQCWARYRDNGDGTWVPSRLLYVRANSVSSVRHVPPEERDPFLEAMAPDLLERLREKERSAA